MSPNDTDDYYTDILQQLGSENWESSQYVNKMKMSYSVTYIIIIILCVIFNFTVIVISCRLHKSFQSVGIWIMALAVTHLVTTISVVFQFLYAYNDFKWLYKNASCKTSSYISYGSMFFTAAMLSLWTIHSAFSNVCMNMCKGCNVILISLSWAAAAILACPSLFSREVRNLQCIDDFDFDDSSTTTGGVQRLKAAVTARFLCGLLVPALSLIITCCVVRKRVVETRKIVCALKTAYFVCWGPLIFLTMIQVTANDSVGENVVKYVLPGATILATSHCFISPLVFLLLGCWNNMDFMEQDHNRDTEKIGMQIY